MSQTHLTHKYRPQRFSEVAGQQVIKSILSRAAATGAVAPAYLFSGTRGVGKTTIARIFAKALNCERGPAAEPCNQCAHCRQIQAGAAVDVMEIDGASHTGVDNVRSLKEDVGFAPIDCRYKVFIIDEAHMLSKGAFNALLKTLEEPPAHATFIMATTEPHKFPATIISRCQHYTFQRLGQKEIEAHLTFLLDAEHLAFDADAVALLARRGAGSVRDAMSLLGQVLALGGEKLTSADVRQVLGLAGREIMFRLLAAIHGRDGLGVSTILHEILDQGLDLGFFLRELTECWRTLFLLGQSGEAALGVLDISTDEAPQWLEWTRRFDPAHVHACWQLTLEGQQRVKGSLEPALALELLLLNLACLPRLLPLGDIARTGAAPAAPPAPGAPAGQGGPAPQAPPRPGGAPRGAARGREAGGASPAASASEDAEADDADPGAAFAAADPAPQDVSIASAAPEPAPEPDPDSGPDPEPDPDAWRADMAEPGQQPPAPEAPLGPAQTPPRTARRAAPPTVTGHGVPLPEGPRTWEGFKEFARAVQEATGRGINGLMQAGARFEEGTLTLECQNQMHCTQIRRGEAFAALTALVGEYFGPDTAIGFHVPERQQATHKELEARARAHPLVQSVMQAFDAGFVDARPADEGNG